MPSKNAPDPQAAGWIGSGACAQPILDRESQLDRERFERNRDLNDMETRSRKIVLQSNPLRFGVIATTVCNLRCIMCLSSRHTKDATLSASALAKIDELLPFLERIEWQGGEVFGIDHIRDYFVTLSRYPQISHRFTTNGLLLDEEWIELLLACRSEITFSIDGARKETYERIRRGGRFEDLIRNLNLIRKMEMEHHKSIRRHLTVVVMASNCQELAEFVPFAAAFGFYSLSFRPVMLLENEENIFQRPDFDGRSLAVTGELMRRKCEELNIAFCWMLPTPPEDQSPRTAVPVPLAADRLFCNYPWKSLWISADREGDIFPDCWCRQPIGNVSTETCLQAWNSEKMQEYRRRIIMHDSGLCNKDCVTGYSAAVDPKNYE